MTGNSFRVDFGKSWKTYSEALRASAPEIIRTFEDTRFKDNFTKWYQLAMPKRWESPISFLLRNANLSRTIPPEHKREITESKLNHIMARLAWYTDKIPLIRRIIRLNGVSTELYLGQKSNSYFRDGETLEGNGLGNDSFLYVSLNLARPLDLDIDVGFNNPKSPKKGRNWFYQINVFEKDLIDPAQQAIAKLKAYSTK